MNGEPILFVASTYYNSYIATATRVFTTTNTVSSAYSIMGSVISSLSSYWKQIVLPSTTISYVSATPTHIMIYSGTNVSVIGTEDYGQMCAGTSASIRNVVVNFINVSQFSVSTTTVFKLNGSYYYCGASPFIATTTI